jgi:hypothetical protein
VRPLLFQEMHPLSSLHTSTHIIYSLLHCCFFSLLPTLLLVLHSLTHSLTHSLILCSLHSYHTTTHPNMHSIRRMLSPSPLSSSLLSLSRQPLRHSLSHTLTRPYTDDSSFHHVTSDQWDLIGKYENELLEWNKKVNLISRKDAAVSGKVMTDHILPCLSISILRPFVPGETVLDAGYVS